MRQILRLTAATDGTGTADTFALTDPNYFYEGVTSFRLPLGCKAKLWGYTLSGAAFTATLSVSHDAGATHTEAARWDLLAEGTLVHTHDGRPEVFLESRTGKESFKVDWSQATAAKGRIAMVVEISDEG